MKKLLLILVALLLVGCTLRVESVPATTTTAVALSTTTSVATTTLPPTTTTTKPPSTTTTLSDNFDDWSPEQLAEYVKFVDPVMFANFSVDELILSADNICNVVDAMDGDMAAMMVGFEVAWEEDHSGLTREEVGAFIAASVFIAGYGDLCPRWKATLIDFIEGMASA